MLQRWYRPIPRNGTFYLPLRRRRRPRRLFECESLVFLVVSCVSLCCCWEWFLSSWHAERFDSADDGKALTKIEGIWKPHGQIASDGTVRELEGDAARVISPRENAGFQYAADCATSAVCRHASAYEYLSGAMTMPEMRKPQV